MNKDHKCSINKLGLVFIKLQLKSAPFFQHL